MRTLTARLAAARRSRFAGPVAVLLALLVAGSAYAALSPSPAVGAAGGNADVAKGRALFAVGCASCHGLNGQGITTTTGGQYGPPLVGVGAAAVDFQVSSGRMPLAAPGQQAPLKAPTYTTEEIRQLAAYVASLGPGPAIPRREQYDPSAIPASQREAAIVRGGAFFRTNCTACHNFAGAGGALPQGKYAPSLEGVPARRVYEALITGPQQMPVFSDDVLKPTQKRDIIAYLQSIETAPAYGGARLGSFGPVSEGFFAWVVGLGVLVGFAVWIASRTARSTRKGTSDE